ncbi:MAG: polysaccharide deacetylase family protein [Gammaproteobacteria bacterium]|nr:polysaccharide deacetylase family protein [Gammaproteobacteria bacterium]
MLRTFLTSLTFLLLTSLTPCYSESAAAAPDKTPPPIREIAITLDDLPLVGSTGHNEAALKREHDRFFRILDVLVDNHIPATGFVIAGSIGKGQWAFLEAFHDAGLTIGNHTYSHANLNSMSSEKYIENVERADKILNPLMSHPRYFRYPYLAEGRGEKKAEVQQYLAEHDYIIAPITIDTKDFRFNSQLYRVPYRSRPNYLPKLKKQYLSYIWKQTLRAEKKANGKPVKQIILLHANLLNSHFLGDIIQMYRDHGYTFISLEEALKSQAQSTSLDKAQQAQTANTTESAT